MKWFIQLRWIFLVGLFLTVLSAAFIFHIELPINRIIVVGIIVFIWNSALYYLYSTFKWWLDAHFRINRFMANLQIGLDLLILTFLIHFSGGVENPFVIFYLFHAIMGSILLPRAAVWFQGLTALCLFIVFIGLEYLGVIPHYHLKGFSPEGLHLDLLYISVISCVLMVTLFSTIYMISSIVQSLHVHEAQLFSTQDMLRKKSSELETANQQLLEKQKQLVLSEKLMSLGQLAAGMAHEINNPVQFIQGNLSIIKEALDGIIPILDDHAIKNPHMKLARLEYAFFREHCRVLVNDMTKGTEHISDIVRDLKAFSRSDEGRRDQEVDVNEVVRVCQRLVHNKIKRYRVEKDLDPDLPCLRGNINEIEQVVMANLINAADALTGKSDGMIKIITRTEDGGKEISLSICDNGAGMTDEVMEKIFDPFFTTRQRSGGTGLGLSVTYGIVKEHGGRIDVKSKVGERTVFTYRWPVRRSG